MKIALALLMWAAVLAGAWVIWMASQLYPVRPGVFGVEGLTIVFAVWMTLEAQMWMTIISFIGGPVIKGLIDGYKAKLAAGNTSGKIASETASAEIAAQVSETNAIMQYRIAEIGHWYEPDKLMGYFVAIY